MVCAPRRAGQLSSVRQGRTTSGLHGGRDSYENEKDRPTRADKYSCRHVGLFVGGGYDACRGGSLGENRHRRRPVPRRRHRIQLLGNDHRWRGLDLRGTAGERRAGHLQPAPRSHAQRLPGRRLWDRRVRHHQEGLVNWGGTDVPMQQATSTKTSPPAPDYTVSDFVQVPIGLGGVAIAYNLPGLKARSRISL